MRTSILCLSCALGVLLAPGGGSFARADDYENLVDQYLQQMGAEGYFMTPENNAYVTPTFPEYVFFGVYFQQYPLGITPPEGLAESNVFLMDTVTEDINFLIAPEDLLAFFQANWTPPPGGAAQRDSLKNAAKTWLELSAQFSQDGYYRFSPPAVEEVDGKAYGVIKVEQGGKGFLSVTMAIGPTGTLSVEEVRQIQRGIRPL